MGPDDSVNPVSTRSNQTAGSLTEPLVGTTLFRGGRSDNYELVPRDSFNREIDYLRLSVIDACNLRCVYCMPLEGLRFLPREELLTPAEIELVVRAAVSVGFR